jgi:hypothetical protein
MKTKNIEYFIYWFAIFTVSISMVSYAILKPLQFPIMDFNQIKEPLTGHQIMWMFYGYSKAYVILIGFLEFFGGILLLFRKTRIFGCLLLTTILINIILQDYFYEIAALKTAILYQLLILVILYFDRKEVRELFIKLFNPDRHDYKNYLLMVLALTVAILFVLYETRIMKLI